MPVGRPTKLTPGRQQRVVAALLAGATHEVAARQGGISGTTHFKWMQRGKKAVDTARSAGRAELVSDTPAGERSDAAVQRIARDISSIASAREQPFAEYREACEGAVRLWELGQIALIQRAATGQPYERRREVTRDEIVGYDDQGAPRIVTLRTVTVETGAKVDWRAGAWMLAKRRPEVYGDLVRHEDVLTAEQQGLLLAKAVEGVLADLGVERRPDVQQVVHRHLMLVADEADQLAS